MQPSESLKFNRPLRAHQAAALDRFAVKDEAALFWEMGTGKTTAAIAWLRAHGISKTLIISPVATLYNWLDEFKLNAPQDVVNSVLVPYMRSRRMRYTCAQRAELIKHTKSKIIILNGESLDSQEVTEALKEFAPQTVIVDESHKFKNPDMYSHGAKKRTHSRLGKLLSISDKAARRMMLTGTPILNSYLDIWSQFRFLDRGLTFGTNFYVFREQYFQDENIKWKGRPKYFPHFVPKPEVHTVISEKIGEKASRLQKSECLDLPPLVQQKHYVELSEDQARAYYQMEQELLTEVQNGICAAVNALSKVQRLLQILSGHLPVSLEDDEKVLTYFKPNPRLDAARELITELTPAHKVILWCSFRANYSQVRTMLKGLGLEWAELTGETKDRQAEIVKFQTDQKCRVMLANAQAGGVGVNLTAASYAIYYSRSYSLGDRAQSEARNHRDGSQCHEKVTLIDLVAKDTLDEDVLAALLRKEKFSDNVLARLKK